MKVIQLHCHRVMTIGDRIAEVRRENRLTLDEMGRIAGCTRGAIHALEQGRSAEPKVSTILRIAEHFKISLIWLINGKGDKRESDHNEIDAHVLSEIIAGVEMFLNKRGLEHTPESKARIVAYYYKDWLSTSTLPTESRLNDFFEVSGG